jgi:RNA polymerase sigma-70 factor (ECF subfamily)
MAGERLDPQAAFLSRSPMRTLDPQSLSQHVDRLYRAAWALCGSREDAEDLVQETFARVLARPRILTGDDDLYYLMRVLRNTYFTSLRTASRRPATVATLEDVDAADPRRLGEPQRALEMQELYAAIATLPEDRRLVLVAVDVLGLSYREAARALRVREATVTTRLFRARKQVAQGLAPGDERLAPGVEGLAPGDERLAPGVEGLAPGDESLASEPERLASTGMTRRQSESYPKEERHERTARP